MDSTGAYRSRLSVAVISRPLPLRAVAIATARSSNADSTTRFVGDAGRDRLISGVAPTGEHCFRRGAVGEPGAQQRGHERLERETEVDLREAEPTPVGSHDAHVVRNREHCRDAERVSVDDRDGRHGKRQHARATSSWASRMNAMSSGPCEPTEELEIEPVGEVLAGAGEYQRR